MTHVLEYYGSFAYTLFVLIVLYLEEELTLDSFHLLDESDLSDLGFKMGARKILMKWSRSVSAGSLAQDVPPVPAVQQTASAATADPSTASSVSTTVPSSTGEVSVATSQVANNLFTFILCLFASFV